MISTFKTQKVIEKRMKFLPAVIKKNPDNEDFILKIFDHKDVKVRTYREMEKEPFSFITETRIELNGVKTQRYTTSCYFHQVPTPVWYTESLLVDLEEKTQKINEKIYYDNKFRPNHWSETFTTDVTSKRDVFLSEAIIPVEQEVDKIRYISLEPQQIETEKHQKENGL